MEFTVANWHDMIRVITKTRNRAFQILGQAFEALRENQKLGPEFEMLGRVSKKLGRMFLLQRGPCCPNQTIKLWQKVYHHSNSQ